MKSAQDGVLELLLINHPLDCPVCDRGGECPLQDTTLAFGPGESRFAEEKRHWEKPIPISDLVLLDRERCIQCARCTRFADEIAGDPLITFGERGGHTEIVTFPGEPFASYFSGNIVQICPVGALTSKPYRFKARPWDLTAVETSCTACAVQCRGALESSSNRLVRLLGVDSEPVNHGWLCDKGRYGYEAVHHEARVAAPDDPTRRRARRVLVARGARRRGRRAPRRARGRRCRSDRRRSVAPAARTRTPTSGPASPRASCGTDNVDAQLGDGLPAEVALGLPHATIADLDRARGIVVLGVDLKEELPVLYLRARRAAAELGVPLIERRADRHRASRRTPPRASATRRVSRVRSSPTSPPRSAVAPAASADIAAAAAALADRDGDIVVIVGPGQPGRVGRRHRRRDRARSPDSPSTRFLVALRRGNVRGALDLGLAPGFLPGRVDARGRTRLVRGCVGRGAGEPGLDAVGILAGRGRRPHRRAGAARCRPARRLPRPGARRGRASTGARFVIAVDTFLTDSTSRADVFLPVTTWGEQDGTRHQPRGARAARRAARSRPTAPRCPTGASPPSSRCGCARTSTSRPPKRSRTRSPASRRRSPASRARSCSGRATASCCRSPSTPTRSSCAASRSRSPTRRGSRSCPARSTAATPPPRRTEVVDGETEVEPTAADEDRRRPTSPTDRRGRHRDARRRRSRRPRCTAGRGGVAVHGPARDATPTLCAS